MQITKTTKSTKQAAGGGFLRRPSPLWLVAPANGLPSCSSRFSRRHCWEFHRRAWRNGRRRLSRVPCGRSGLPSSCRKPSAMPTMVCRGRAPTPRPRTCSASTAATTWPATCGRFAGGAVPSPGCGFPSLVEVAEALDLDYDYVRRRARRARRRAGWRLPAIAGWERWSTLPSWTDAGGSTMASHAVTFWVSTAPTRPGI